MVGSPTKPEGFFLTAPSPITKPASISIKQMATFNSEKIEPLGPRYFLQLNIIQLNIIYCLLFNNLTCRLLSLDLHII